VTLLRGLLLVAEKEFRHFRNDQYTLVLTVLAPLSQLLLFGRFRSASSEPAGRGPGP
jgi:hypothetical protein